MKRVKDASFLDSQVHTCGAWNTEASFTNVKNIGGESFKQ